MSASPVHARFDGPIVMIGFGSIGRGTLPLILRHIECDRDKFTVIDPEDEHRDMVSHAGVNFIHDSIRIANYRELLTPLLTAGPGRAFVVNLSVDVSSVAIRARIRKLIADELPDKPLSDAQLATILADEGVKVARRTVAKYREALGLASSSERRQATARDRA